MAIEMEEIKPEIGKLYKLRWGTCISPILSHRARGVNWKYKRPFKEVYSELYNQYAEKLKEEQDYTDIIWECIGEALVREDNVYVFKACNSNFFELSVTPVSEVYIEYNSIWE